MSSKWWTPAKPNTPAVTGWAPLPGKKTQPAVPPPAKPATFFQSPSGFNVNKDFGVAAAQGQAFKDTAAFGALANIGVAGQNATGQYGVSKNNSLANQSVAAANAYGQMANNWYNTMGQLGQIGGALSAAGLNAGAQSGSASQGGTSKFGSSFGGPGGGGGGFMSTGPEGAISSGGMGGPGGGFGGGASGGGSSWSTASKGSSPQDQHQMLSQGYGFLGGLQGTLNSPNSQAAALAGLLDKQLSANLAATTNPAVLKALQSQTKGLGNAVGGLYGMSDYGFNTAKAGKTIL